jgi:hypothetical protein
MAEEQTGAWMRGAALVFGLVLITSPLWKPESEEAPPADRSGVEVPPPAENRVFRHEAALERTRQRADDDQVVLQQQLYRLARMEREGVVARVVDNPDMPPEIRERFAAEYQRLQQVAAQHPEASRSIRESLPEPRLKENGEFTESFREVVHNMKVYGVWDQIVDEHVEQMVRDANDPNLPEEERPTAEEIEAFRSQRLIPAL